MISMMRSIPNVLPQLINPVIVVPSCIAFLHPPRADIHIYCIYGFDYDEHGKNTAKYFSGIQPDEYEVMVSSMSG